MNNHVDPVYLLYFTTLVSIHRLDSASLIPWIDPRFSPTPLIGLVTYN